MMFDVTKFTLVLVGGAALFGLMGGFAASSILAIFIKALIVGGICTIGLLMHESRHHNVRKLTPIAVFAMVMVVVLAPYV